MASIFIGASGAIMDIAVDITTLLDDSENTALLVSQNEQNNTDDIMLDITFIHTELVL